MSIKKYTTLSFPCDHVALVCLDRPDKLNAVNWDMLAEIDSVVSSLPFKRKDVRCVILASSSAHFTSGIDLATAGDIVTGDDEGDGDDRDVARKSLAVSSQVRTLQHHVGCFERCPVPVIAAISGLCLGLGVDIASACDIRLASRDAAFAIKEVDVGICADLGTIQRFHRIVGNDSWFRELCYTAKKFGAEEAERRGFLSGVHDNKKEMMDAAISLGQNISQKSPVAVATTKRSILFSRDSKVEEGLEHIALMNGAMLQTEDISKVVEGFMTGKKGRNVIFSKL